MPHPSWNESYAAGALPWDTGEPEPLLVEFVTSGRVRPTRTLEIGAGTGTNALYLAECGFNVLGIDVAPLAVERATAKLNGRDLSCRFAAVDFLADSPVNGPFGFDSGGLSSSFLTAAVFMSSINLRSAHIFPRGSWRRSRPEACG